MALDFDLQGKAVLVTGANSGIGRQTALTLAQHGADVAVHYLASTALQPGAEHTALGQDTAEAVVAAIRSFNRRSVAIEGDLALPETAARLIREGEEALGPLYGLVNNAAHCELPDTILEAGWDSYRRPYDVNLGAPTLLMAEFARVHTTQARTAGRIVNISTDSARAFPGQIFYGTSKAALEAMTRAVSIELGPYGITVNAVAPGPVQTGYIDEELERVVLPSIPLARIGAPVDIALTVAFLLSDAASWVTGQVIQAAGGHAL